MRVRAPMLTWVVDIQRAGRGASGRGWSRAGRLARGFED